MNGGRILMIVAGIGLAVYLVKKSGVAGTPHVDPLPSTSVQGDKWALLMGDSWNQNAYTSGALTLNTAGQLTTADGKPIGTGDPGTNYALAQGIGGATADTGIWT